MPLPLNLTPWQAHVRKWEHCTRCPLHLGRRRVCLARGDLPADVLFVGEGPGDTEDTLGVVFSGPAGQLLDAIVAEGLPPGLTRCFTNLLGCIPLEFPDGSGPRAKCSDPPHEAIQVCGERLRELVTMARPRLVVAVGKWAQGYLGPGLKHSVTPRNLLPCWPGRPGEPAVVGMDHPAYILRAKWAAQSSLYRNCVVQLRAAARELTAATVGVPAAPAGAVK